MTTNNEQAVFVCSHIFNKTHDILYVSHSDGVWQFICGEDHSNKEQPRVVGLNHIVDFDNSIRDVLDLPNDWEAERVSKLGAWRKFKGNE